MEVSKGIREFKYNGVALRDPGPDFSIEKVREFYATIYPEIVNAAIEGPNNVGNKVVYEFRKAVGTKGSVRDRVERMIARQTMEAVAAPSRSLEQLHGYVAEEIVSHRAFRGHELDAPALPALLPPLP